jgi:hypothetical protein
MLSSLKGVLAGMQITGRTKETLCYNSLLPDGYA